MQRRVIGLVVAALVLAAVPASAGKIGWVQVERAVATVKQGKQVLKQLEEWAKPRQEHLKSLADAATQARQQAARQSGVSSEEAADRLQKQAVAAQRSYEDAVRDFKREYNQKQNETLKPVADRLNAVISDYAKSHDFDAVLIFKPQTIIYLAETSDLTDTIIKLYDERFPAS